MTANHYQQKGLTTNEVEASRAKHGSNKVEYKKENGFIEAMKKFVKDPMVILLIVAASIYFISGKTGDGIFLLSAIVLISTISLYQDSRSRNALEKLKDFTQPKSKVIRNGTVEEINSEELVIGDSLMVEEGSLITADGLIVHSTDFSVNESILTGESMSVEKDSSKTDNVIFQGTTVTSGMAIATITCIGADTKLGKIGKSLENIKEEKTPLEIQINNFVVKMAIVGTIIFLIVWAINFYHSKALLDSLLKALTLAMSILPEEIPIAFTTFMALGAWRMMKMGLVVKQMKTVETLGSATVICTDKTGTITENNMSLAKLYVFATDKIISPDAIKTEEEKELLQLSMWASEPIPFDPMEIALHQTYEKTFQEDKRIHYKLVHEYPLGGKPPMMTHVFETQEGHRIIAAKGAPEAFINICKLTSNQQIQIEHIISQFAADGFRVLGVAEAKSDSNNFPAQQQDFEFVFKGIVAFYDPPKQNIKTVLDHFYNAGINVKIITGDNAETTKAIAKLVGFRHCENSISGDELMKLSEKELQETVVDTNIFTRMFPEAKLKIINALKAKNEIVAMTGDGVNDGPALKAAHIGIAMGKKGTEIAKQAASLILVEDDLEKMVDAVAAGRKIYANLKKAIQFVISIHIPIILTVFIPLALDWIYPNILSPIHIIFLELIMGPTCSIIYENEPMEKNTMLQQPRPFSSTFFSFHELTISIVQGLMITAGALATYQYAIYSGCGEHLTRTMVFTVLIVANVFLTLVNRSFYYSILVTLRYKNNLVLIITTITIAITGLLVYVEPLANFFEFEKLNLTQLLFSISVGFLSVIWAEAFKWGKRLLNNTPDKQNS